jgi:hypothetical protein
VLAIAKSHGVPQGSGWMLKQQACVEIFGARCKKVAQFEHVFVALRAKGRALEVDVVSSCFGDSCSVEAWLYTDVRPPRTVDEPPFVVDPNLSWLVFDQITPIAAGAWDVRLARLDLVTGAKTTFADCVSPSLSPGEKWIACRTKDGSVYRVPVAGGTPTLVLQGTGAVVWIPYAHAFPPEVSFPSSTTFEIEGNNSPQVFPWTE